MRSEQVLPRHIQSVLQSEGWAIQGIQGTSRRSLCARTRGLPSAQSDGFRTKARGILCGTLLYLVCLGTGRYCHRRQCTRGGRKKNGEPLCRPRSWSISYWKECWYSCKAAWYPLVLSYYSQRSPEYVVSQRQNSWNLLKQTLLCCSLISMDICLFGRVYTPWSVPTVSKQGCHLSFQLTLARLCMTSGVSNSGDCERIDIEPNDIARVIAGYAGTPVSNKSCTEPDWLYSSSWIFFLYRCSWWWVSLMAL